MLSATDVRLFALARTHDLLDRTNAEDRDRLQDAVWQIARHRLAVVGQVPPAIFHDAELERDSEALKQAALAFLEATEIARAILDRLVDQIVFRSTDHSHITYAELGTPFGISGRAAQKRWPFAILPENNAWSPV